MKQLILSLSIILLCGINVLNAQNGNEGLEAASKKAPENVKKIVDPRAGVTQIPEKVVLMVNLEELNLALNQIDSLPADIYKLKSLKHLDLGGNNLKELPETIVAMQQLEDLRIWRNDFNRFPVEVFELKNLKRFDYSDNKLNEIPVGLTELTKLERLDLASNPITKFPDEIVNLTNLKKLDLSGTKLSKSKQKKLQKLLPDTDINF